MTHNFSKFSWLRIVPGGFSRPRSNRHCSCTVPTKAKVGIALVQAARFRGSHRKFVSGKGWGSFTRSRMRPWWTDNSEQCFLLGLGVRATGARIVTFWRCLGEAFHFLLGDFRNVFIRMMKFHMRMIVIFGEGRAHFSGSLVSCALSVHTGTDIICDENTRVDAFAVGACKNLSLIEATRIVGRGDFNFAHFWNRCRGADLLLALVSLGVSYLLVKNHNIR